MPSFSVFPHYAIFICMKDFIEVKTKRYRYLLVQKEIRHKGEAYISVREAAQDSAADAADAGAAHLEKNGAQEIYYTCRDKAVTLPDIFETPGARMFRHVYDMDWLEKDLSGFTPGETALSLQPLNAKNRAAFRCIYNECFMIVPNGATYSRRDVTKLLSDQTIAGLVMHGNAAVGMYELSYDEGAYAIEAVGITQACRGMGYGMQAVSLLLADIRGRGGQKAGLLVCTANKTAYRLYIRAGFEKRSTRSRWYRMD